MIKSDIIKNGVRTGSTDYWILLGWVYTGVSAEPHNMSSIGEGAFVHDAAILFPHMHSLKRLESQICVCVLSRFSHLSPTLCDSLWTVALQILLYMGFFRQGYWRGLPFPPPGDLPDLGIEPVSLTSPALAGGFFAISATWEAPNTHHRISTAYCYELRY